MNTIISIYMYILDYMYKHKHIYAHNHLLFITTSVIDAIYYSCFIAEHIEGLKHPNSVQVHSTTGVIEPGIQHKSLALQSPLLSMIPHCISKLLNRYNLNKRKKSKIYRNVVLGVIFSSEK